MARKINIADTKLKTKELPVYLRALKTFSYNGMVDENQFFEAHTFRDARELIALELAEEVTKNDVDDELKAIQLAPAGAPWLGEAAAVTNADDEDWGDDGEDWEDDEEETDEEETAETGEDFKAAIAAADTHAEFEGVYTAAGLAVPAKATKNETLADRKARALA